MVIRDYTTRVGLTRMNMISGGFMTAVGLLGLLTNGSALLLPFGITILILAFVNGDKTIIGLRNDHVFIKGAPLAGAKHIPYRDIVAVERESEKKAKLRLRNGDRVALPLAAIEEELRSDLLNRIGRRLVERSAA